MKLTAEQRVQRAHVSLMSDKSYCLYSGVFMLGDTSVVEDLPTACTNGRDTMYGRKFIDGLSDDELRGIVLHENLHKAFRHLTLWQPLWEENPRLANLACDFVINLMIVDYDGGKGFVSLPKGACYDEKYRGMDAGSVYRLLKEQKQQDNGQGFDDHDWKGARELTAKERNLLEKEIDEALRQGVALAGKMKGDVPQELKELLQSKVDWREALRDFINSNCADKTTSTWARPNRRWISRGIYMPTLIGESVGRIVLAVDTSGSVVNCLGKFLGEFVRIIETVPPDGVDLIYWDSCVAGHEKYDRDNYHAMLTSTKPKGGGGTSPQCIVDYLKKNAIKPECVIVLTDGYVESWGDGWTSPVLWGVTTKDIVADVGVTMEI